MCPISLYVPKKKSPKFHILLILPNFGLKMLNFLIHFSIRNKLIVGLFVLVLIAFGSYELTRLPIDAVPDITDNQVQIITVTPALGAPEVERLITFPIEQATANVPNIVEMRSFSRFGLSLVTVVFTDKTDVYWARQQISERLQKVQTQLPNGIGTPELAPVTTGLGEIFQYVVRPKTGFEKAFSPTDLRTIQDWIVRRQLLGVEGVADVSSFGGALKQYEIAVNPDRLKAQNLTIADIFNAVEKNNQNTGGAYIEKGATVLYIRSEGLVGSMTDIEAIPVRNTEGGLPILIRDVATVKLGNATRYGAMCFNDKGEVAGAVVMMLKGENSSKVILKVKERIAEIQKTLPDGVVIEAFLDRTKMVNNAISTVETNLLEGALIVVFVLVLFLGNLRAGLLVASVIPLAMLFAVILMNLFGVSGNLMSLGALDFGLIIDGAVIIVESVLHALSNPHASTNVFANSFAPVTANSFAEENDETTTEKQQVSTHHSANKFAGTGANEFANTTTNAFDTQVENTTKKMMNAAVFGQIIILIVYLPILSLQGIEGKMFRPMAQTVAFALLGAFILSLTYVPMMSALLLKNAGKTPNFADKIMKIIAKKYQKGLFQILRFPKFVIGSALILLLISTFILRGLGGEFIPALEEGDFAVDTRVLTGSSLTTTIEATQKTAKILLERFPEVEKVVTKIGSGEIPTDPMPIEASDMMVILKNKKQWTSAKTFDELAEKMSVAVSDVPGVTAGFQFPVQMRFNELMTGARQDVVCKIFGEDLDSLALYADKLGAIAVKIDGAKDLYVETVTGMPQITVEFDRAAIARFGLNIEDVNRTLKTAFAGETAGVLYEGERRFDIVVRLEGGERKDLSNVQNLLIATPKGEQIPLSMVAKVAIKEGLNQIQREDAKRRITVGFNVRGVDIQTVVEKLKRQTDKNLKLPTGYRLTFGGQFENLNAAKLRLSIAVPVALLLIFLMLYFAFGSVKQGILVFSAIPLATIGGVFALWLRGMPFSISAGIGFIALFGVAVLNGIVLISECNRLKNEGHAYLKGIVLTATKTRLRPVLMTAAVASLGFLPMALSNGSGAEVQRPLATVVIGGLLTATLLTLFVLPILYLIFEKKRPLSIKSKLGVFIAFLFLFSNNLSAQNAVNQEITLEQAFDLAFKNNPNIRTEKIKATQFERLEGTAFDLPKTDVGAEFGQINSRAFDSRLTISQSFSQPKVYQQRRDLLKAETKLQWLNVIVLGTQLKYDIAFIYYELLFLKNQKRLYQKQDSVLATNLRNADIRLKTGESGILEKTSAETQRLKLQHDLQQLDLEINFYQIQLQNRVYTEGVSFSDNPNVKADFKLTNDTSLLNNHPELLYFKQQLEVAQQQILVEKNTLKPSFSIGYGLQAIQGTQTFSGRDYTYNALPQFSTIQFGMQLPLFKKATESRIEAAKIGNLIAQNQLESKALMRQNQLREWTELFKKTGRNVDYYEKTALPQAKRLIELATISRRNGDIGYAEWSLATMQSWAIEQEYLEAIRAYNRVVLDIQTLFDFKK